MEQQRIRLDETHQQRHYPIKVSTPPSHPQTVIPVHTGIHSSTRAGCRVWKCTCHRQQHRAKLTTALAMKR
ncbi:TPA: hypothetical protein I7751_02920 [Vibrio vulnificus]|nr:hypothetical protein D8T46_06230 [Vibrio vulnificus]HAS8498407.1 hypothetical protein [Vibrio vulnificus]